MIYRALAAILLLLTVGAVVYLFRPQYSPPNEVPPNQTEPESQLEKPGPLEAVPMLMDGAYDAKPVGLLDQPEPVPAPLPQAVLDDDLDVPSLELTPSRPKHSGHGKARKSVGPRRSPSQEPNVPFPRSALPPADS
jgi:hypothetical protein